MRFWLKNFVLTMLVAILACPVLMTGCRSHTTNVYSQQEPPDYRQWEHDTNRQHVDLDKRSADEQREYREWQLTHNHQ